MNNSEKLTALVFGATGLTGRFVLELLMNDNRYDEIRVFVRNEIKINSGKIKQHIFTSEKIEEISDKITGDHLFCCIGTTIKKAGSKSVFYNIDHDLVEKIAEIASSNNVKSFSVISSAGANSNSRNFYLNTKGKMEISVKKYRFNNLTIVRPGMLMGIREERRPLEEVGKVLVKVLSPLMVGPLKKYKPIHSATVAGAMISLANQPNGEYIIESNEIQNYINN